MWPQLKGAKAPLPTSNCCFAPPASSCLAPDWLVPVELEDSSDEESELSLRFVALDWRFCRLTSGLDCMSLDCEEAAMGLLLQQQQPQQQPVHLLPPVPMLARLAANFVASLQQPQPAT